MLYYSSFIKNKIFIVNSLVSNIWNGHRLTFGPIVSEEKFELWTEVHWTLQIRISQKKMLNLHKELVSLADQVNNYSRSVITEHLIGA
jgi:hypothetical protein